MSDPLKSGEGKVLKIIQGEITHLVIFIKGQKGKGKTLQALI
jgi:hypothetical protein